MKKKIHKIIIADDNNFFADALKEYLNRESDIEVLATCNTLQETIQSCNTEVFDALVLDLSFKGQKSTDFIDQIRNNEIPFKIICLTTYANKIIEKEALDSGVDDFVSKEGVLEDFPNVIRNVLKRRKPLKTKKTNIKEKYNLTKRQIDIIKACFDFTSEKEIADFLGISINTLKTHKQNLFAKTATKNNIELIKYGIEEGIIVV